MIETVHAGRCWLHCFESTACALYKLLCDRVTHRALLSCPPGATRTAHLVAGAKGKGLHEKASSVQQMLRPDLVRKIRYLATIRNKLVHERGFNSIPVSPAPQWCCWGGAAGSAFGGAVGARPASAAARRR